MDNDKAYYELKVISPLNGDYVIGRFSSEEALEKWARENKGELEKSEA